MALSKIGSAGIEAGAVSPTSISDQANSSTGYFDIPTGTTAERPGTPATGMIRFNSTDTSFEYYDGTGWRQPADAPYTVEYLVVAGGGGGGIDAYSESRGGGGGGGGGFRASTLSVNGTDGYTVTIGAGGAGGTGGSVNGVNGSNSVFSSITSTGGGGGGGHSLASNNSGNAGGSGGGGANGVSGGAGTSGQGNAGGQGAPNSPFFGAGGGTANAQTRGWGAHFAHVLCDRASSHPVCICL